ncbi:hypothetical protein MRX96_039733 [Rhipicephalus microplus]
MRRMAARPRRAGSDRRRLGPVFSLEPFRAAVKRGPASDAVDKRCKEEGEPVSRPSQAGRFQRRRRLAPIRQREGSASSKCRTERKRRRAKRADWRQAPLQLGPYLAPSIRARCRHLRWVVGAQ